MISILFKCLYAYIDLGFAALVMGLLFVFAGFRAVYFLLGVDSNA